MKTYKILIKSSLLFLASLFLTACSDSEESMKSIAVADYQLTNEEGTKKINMTVKESLQLHVLISPSDAYNKKLKFDLEGSEVVSVTHSGKLEALALGTDKLTITSLDDPKLVVVYPVEVVARIVKAEKLELAADDKNISLATNLTYNLSNKFKFIPADVTDKRVSYKSLDETVIKVNNKGEVTAIAVGEADVIITSMDGSGVHDIATFTVADKIVGPIDYDRNSWTVTVSHDLPPEAGNNKGDCIIDDDQSTFLSMVKPGFSLNSITIKADEEVFFTVDMKKKQEVDYFRYIHRNKYPILRFFSVTVLGSNDGTTFTVIKENIELPGASTEGTDTMDSGNISIPKSSYQYYRVVFTDWNHTSAEVGQLSEFYLGHTIAEDK